MFSSIVSHPNRACSEVTVLIFKGKTKEKKKALRQRALKTENYGNYVIHNTHSYITGKYYVA